jgi:hypothetical protein
MVPRSGQKVIKCEAATREAQFCKFCGQPVQWLRSVSRQHWNLFETAATVVREKVVDGVAFTYLDAAGLHARHCAGLAASSGQAAMARPPDHAEHRGASAAALPGSF